MSDQNTPCVSFPLFKSIIFLPFNSKLPKSPQWCSTNFRVFKFPEPFTSIFHYRVWRFFKCRVSFIQYPDPDPDRFTRRYVLSWFINLISSRGQVHLLTDSINKAIVDFNKSVSINPNFPVAYSQKLFTDYRNVFKRTRNGFFNY